MLRIDRNMPWKVLDPDGLTPRQLTRLHHDAIRALRTGHLYRMRPQIVLALCARLAQANEQMKELEETYDRLVEEHDASTGDWVRLLEMLGLTTWSSWSTVSETVVAKVEALLRGAPPTAEHDATTNGGLC